MARIIRFYIPDSYKPANRSRYAQGCRGKLLQFPPVAYTRLTPARATATSRANSSFKRSALNWRHNRALPVWFHG